MQAYLDIGKKILEEGQWIENKRTGQKTLAIIGATLSMIYLLEPFQLSPQKNSFGRLQLVKCLAI